VGDLVSGTAVKVKICGVTTVADALLAAEAGADAIGLNFFPGSPRCVGAERAAEIVAQLSRTVCRVGVFVDAERGAVEHLAERLGLDALQFHGNESPEFCAGWDRPVIKALRIRGPNSIAAAAAYRIDFILADAHVEGRAGGTGQRVPIEWLGKFPRPHLILAGGLAPENVADAVRAVRPFAVDVASGVECAPGEKDPERVKRFVANAKNA
jgi:phosphoribosylanthranilate isomerase